ncbi:Monooxygenase, FAD-binding protein [Corchorus olitorius]|uniref:Monooxygenase, FAD-binding protein n=1 Tax=Corchorus olitorius TaxID=93759 RepID=A0A1R3JD27_9ROSI|nr:Monooxygenase, FAD-binding protein [Corchorus olitorius]
MEIVEDVVIVGAGIAGLTTSLGLHRLGIRSLVLESSDRLRTTGFAFTTWNNAWKALDAIGVGESLRQQHQLAQGILVTSTFLEKPTAEVSFKGHEIRCLQRKLLLETLANELPSDTIRFSSKVVSIEESGFFKRIHLADGAIIKTKVLIGGDGVNSVVAKWLGFEKPVFTGRSAIRGTAKFEGGHGFGPKFRQFVGKGVRSGFLPCDDDTVYWFMTWTPDIKEEELEEDPIKLKQFAMNKLKDTSDEMKSVMEKTSLDGIISSPLRYRRPWELLWGNISKGNVCVAGDALHPMTPDLGQGGCSALEDGVILARCLAQALLKSSAGEEIKEKFDEEEDKYKRIEMGLKNFAQERRWRSFDLVSTAYMVWNSKFEEELEEDPLKLKQFVISKLKGDALHPMTPDLGQGGCSAMEDALVLARCLAQALLKPAGEEIRQKKLMQKRNLRGLKLMGLKNFSRERRWTSFDLITTSIWFDLT